MNILQHKNEYSLLALFLTPWNKTAAIKALTDFIKNESVNWKSLLYIANFHLCSPLWFVRLSKDGLLPLLPGDLQSYLKKIYEANKERNRVFQLEIMKIYSKLQTNGVQTILLKGSSVFFDNLYGDSGARVIGDIDLLVKPRQANFVQNLLLNIGYEEEPEYLTGFKGYFKTFTPHHLPPLIKPGTFLKVEVHLRINKGQAERILRTHSAWDNRDIIRKNGLEISILSPTYRLLHNTVHSLCHHKAVFTSIISLRDIAEFAYLAYRYKEAITWRNWLDNGSRNGMYRDFRVYLSIAHKLMRMPYPSNICKIPFENFHIARVSKAGNDMTNYPFTNENSPESSVDRISVLTAMILISLNHIFKEPLWVWQNFCFKEGINNIPLRLYYLFKFMVKRSYFRNFLKVKHFRNKLEKSIFFLRKHSAP